MTRRLRYLPSSKQQRQRWQYNNMCYMVAGYVTEVLIGQTWTDAVQSVLLNPLGMTDDSEAIAPLCKAGIALELLALTGNLR